MLVKIKNYTRGSEGYNQAPISYLVRVYQSGKISEVSICALDIEAPRLLQVKDIMTGRLGERIKLGKVAMHLIKAEITAHVAELGRGYGYL